MVKLFMLVGLPASGKSTVAKQLAEEHNATIYSSDELRLELFGDYEVFDKNSILFEELHKRIKNGLENGVNAIYDATNLSRKRRKAFLDTIPKEVYREAVVVYSRYSTCLERDLSRDRVVGEEVIFKMLKSFQFPLESEGFNEIDVTYTDFFTFDKEMSTICKIIDGFEQDNKHHSLTLDKHLVKAHDLSIEANEPREIRTALLWHDIGKLFVKTFEDSKGNASEEAHYYGHENASAYIAMSICNAKLGMVKYIIQLINYHMIPYSLKTEKSKQKWLEILGEKMYNDIIVMNEYDKMAH